MRPWRDTDIYTTVTCAQLAAIFGRVQRLFLPLFGESHCRAAAEPYGKCRVEQALIKDHLERTVWWAAQKAE